MIMDFSPTSICTQYSTDGFADIQILVLRYNRRSTAKRLVLNFGPPQEYRGSTCCGIQISFFGGQARTYPIRLENDSP
jgi:hypothetical protein